MKMHQPAELLSDSGDCPTDATIDLPPPPPSPPEEHGETPVCDLCTRTFATQKTLKGHRQTVHRQSIEQSIVIETGMTVDSFEKVCDFTSLLFFSTVL